MVPGFFIAVTYHQIFLTLTYSYNCMSYKKLYQHLIDCILNGDGESNMKQRQAAFDQAGLPAPLDELVAKVAHNAYKLTDSDIAAAKATGSSENQLFELIICSAVGQASRQYQSGLLALAEATQKGESHAS